VSLQDFLEYAACELAPEATTSIEILQREAQQAFVREQVRVLRLT
jgi:hypothetical protein